MNTTPSAERPLSTRPLTDRQRQCLDFIRKYRSEKGYAPSIREIGRTMGIRSTNGVNDHIAALRRKGYLEMAGREVVARGLRVMYVEPEDVDAVRAENVRLKTVLRRAQDALAKMSASSLDVDDVLGELNALLERGGA